MARAGPGAARLVPLTVITHAPVVVSGLGSSGTRVVAQFLDGLGHHIGHDRNRADDDLLFTLLLKRPRRLLPGGLDAPTGEAVRLLRLFAELSTSARRSTSPAAGAELARAAHEQVRHGIERPTAARRAVWCARRLRALQGTRTRRVEGPWGFKEPTAHLLLPALVEAFPGMRYVHVLRDPRDYAAVPHNQFALWGLAFARDLAPLTDGLEALQLRWWAHTGARALALTAAAGVPTHVVRLEELCDRPEQHVADLAAFLGVSCPSAVRSRLAALVQRPASMGRGSDVDVAVVAGDRCAAQVRALGYDT